LEVQWHAFNFHLQRPEYFTSSSSVPAVLQVCQQSRDNAKYVKSFTNDGDDHYVWLDAANDIVKLSDVALSRMKGSERMQIRRLILDIARTETFFLGFMEPLFDMNDLEELELLSEEGLQTWGTGLAQVKLGFEKARSHEPRWEVPKLLVMDKTGEVMNMENHVRLALSLRGRGRGHARGRGGW
jgi:hypothetical protein